MVTKAIIEDILSDYEVTVRIPTLDAGTSFSDSTKITNLAKAIICVPPQCTYSPTVGDIVIVSFEDNDFGKPIILGCLFKESGNTSAMFANLLSLKVQHDTKLSDQTTIGDISYKQLQNVLTYKEDLESIKRDMLKSYVVGNFYVGSSDITFAGAWGGSLVNFGDEMTITTKGNALRLDIKFYGEYSGGTNFITPVIDNVLDTNTYYCNTNSSTMWCSGTLILPVAPGVHTIQLKQGGNNSGTLTLKAWNYVYITLTEL